MACNVKFSAFHLGNPEGSTSELHDSIQSTEDQGAHVGNTDYPVTENFYAESHGQQIFFGPVNEALEYFEKMGFDCPERQITPDFLTSMTRPIERRVREGFENQTPRTPDDFASLWALSPERQSLLVEIDQYNHDPMRGPDFDAFQESLSLQQARCQRQKSPYTLFYWQQIRLCLWRGYNRVIADPVLLITSVISNIAIVLIVSSIFYNLPMTTSPFYSRGALLFFAILINAFSSQLEIMTLYWLALGLFHVSGYSCTASLLSIT